MSVIEHRSRVELDTDALIEQRHEIQALPCAHHNGAGGCQSGRLSRNPNGGYSGWLVCDACGAVTGSLGLVDSSPFEPNLHPRAANA